MPRRISAFLTASSLLFSGCYSSSRIPDAELKDQLSATPQGDITYVIDRKDGNKSGRFTTLQIKEESLVGLLAGSGERSIPLKDVHYVSKEEFDGTKTALVVGGGVLGFIGLIVLAGLVAGSSADSNDR